MVAWYSGNETTTTERPELNFTVTTTNVVSNSSVLYAGAYSPSNVSKTINVTVGTPENIPGVNGGATTYCVLASGSTPTTTTVALSNGGPAGNSLSYNLSGNGATANTPGGPIASGGTGSAVVGFNPSDLAPLSAGGNPAVGTVTATNLSAYSPQDPPVTININSGVNSLALQERFVDSAEGASNSSTPTPNLGKLLVKNTAGNFATYSYSQSTGNAIPISTTNPVGLSDYSPDALTTLTLLNNSLSTPNPFVYDAPFYNTTDPEAAALLANTNGLGNQLFNTNNVGYANVAITPMLSGAFGSDVSQTEGTFTSANTPPFMEFEQASITGMGLVGENDSMRVYVQWSAYDPATVTATGPAAVLTTGNGFTGTATLSNAIDTTNVITSGASTFNNGLAAAAWVSGTPTFNQTWSRGQWRLGPKWFHSSHHVRFWQFNYRHLGHRAQSRWVDDLVHHHLHAQRRNDQRNLRRDIDRTPGKRAGYHGRSSQRSSGGPTSVQATVASNPSIRTGAYILNGGTLSAPATNLTGSFTQNGGTSNFVSIVGNGAVAVEWWNRQHHGYRRSWTRRFFALDQRQRQSGVGRQCHRG